MSLCIPAGRGSGGPNGALMGGRIVSVGMGLTESAARVRISLMLLWKWASSCCPTQNPFNILHTMAAGAFDRSGRAAVNDGARCLPAMHCRIIL